MFGNIFWSFFFTLYFSIKNSTQLRESERERERERERESVLFLWNKSVLEEPTDLVFYENATVFIFKIMKIPKICIQFLYSNPIFLDTENENGIQIQSLTSFLVVNPTKNLK